MASANDVGSHLLGRTKPTDDQIAGDYPLEAFVSTDPLDAAYAAVLASKSVSPATRNWVRAAYPLLKGLSPVPAPAPPAPVAAVVWADAEQILDQGQTPHCIGFGGAQWGNTLPVDDKFATTDGDRIYYACKAVDGQPTAENGSSVHSLAKVLLAEARLAVYAWATTTDAITKFLLESGPVIAGTDWTNDMFRPDANGYIAPTGDTAGGHCYVLVGYAPAGNGEDEHYVIRNSWGVGWGLQGHAKIKVSDFATLLAAQGEAMAAAELPLG